ncbi:restriction system protein [Naumannella cuiyingiana]|uniref:Restriction system protein n=1 Tax=Naumannella cuiyingiana TaxID=1347891 RepID=A0A7Z0DAV9_9ACTN|nr:restriction endonuclease [Naumannella cuiyingiana]NYI71997.1 restriction system protein [Naumannella cuiyingiana]
MTAPTWEEYMAPALRVLCDGEVHRTREVVAAAADDLDLSLEHRAILIPSGQEQWVNRGNWALSYLARAGAVERPTRGHYRITEIGRNLVAQHSDAITERDLRDVPGYASPRHGAKPLPPPDAAWAVPEPVLDPVEQIETGIDRIEAEVAADLLNRLHGREPAFFEQAVLDLLMAMGYGGAEGRATRTQLSNDGGIDGVVDQDALGLSRIYVQAKRYAPDNPVGRPAVQGFVGALHGNQANQGVFITSGKFSKGALHYADSVPSRVVLIDGDRLARLMIRYGVGVQVKRTLHIVEIDEDFFA